MPPFPSGPTQFRHLARILEIVVFPKVYRDAARLLYQENAISVEGKLSIDERERKIQALKIKPLQEVPPDLNHEAATCVPKLGMTLGYSEICCSADYAESCSPVIELLSMRIILSQFCSDCPIRHRVRKYFFTSKKSAKHSPIHPDL